MKNNRYYVKAFILLFLVFSNGVALAQNVKIMPLGDSITKDVFKANPRADSIQVGYRQSLWLSLEEYGFFNIDFIGSDSAGFGAVPHFDSDNAGFGGFTINRLTELIKNGYDYPTGNVVTTGPYFNTYSPNIILLHIGTNGSDTSAAEIDSLLSYIDSFEDSTNSVIWVLVSRIINQYPYSERVRILNNSIEELVLERIKTGDRLKLIDMENDAGLIYYNDTIPPYINGDLYDGVHPNERGYARMADLFFDSLSVLLNQITPVELASFSSEVNEDSIFLDWTTALELSNYGFELERSPEYGDWEKIGFVEGAGNSYKINKYSFLDSTLTPITDTYYYRLKQIDSSGSYKYLCQIAINVDIVSDVKSAEYITDKFKLEQNYPNPFNPVTTISYYLAKQSYVTIKIYNSLGEEVTDLINSSQGTGNHKVIWNAEDFPSGMYVYIINASAEDGTRFKSSRKMILLK